MENKYICKWVILDLTEILESMPFNLMVGLKIVVFN